MSFSGYLTGLTTSSNKHVLLSFQTKPTLQSQQTEKHVSFLWRPFWVLSLSVCCGWWYSTLSCVYIDVIHILFFYSDSLPSTGTLNNGSTVPTVVHQKKVLLFLPTSPLPPFVRCSWSPQWWSSPLLERASAHPSGWSLMRQGHQWKGSTHPHSLSQNRWLRYCCFTADRSGKSQLMALQFLCAHRR